MSAGIPSLWGDDVSVDVAGPYAILTIQGNELARLTHGLLRTEIKTTKADSTVTHDYRIVAPLLNDYTHHLVTIMHDEVMVYPARLKADFGVFGNLHLPQEQATVNSDAEFIEQLQKLLRSGRVRAVINSLIARSNEKRDYHKMKTEGQSAA